MLPHYTSLDIVSRLTEYQLPPLHSADSLALLQKHAAARVTVSTRAVTVAATPATA